MKRFLCVLAFGLILAAAARADLVPPGTKNLAIEHKIATDKDYPDWTFFVVSGRGGIKSVKLDAKTPLTVSGSSAVGNGPPPPRDKKGPALQISYRSNLLVAIPTETVKKFSSEKELHAAIWALKVEGLVRVKGALSDHTNVKITDSRKSVTRSFRLTRIDPKEGIVLEAVEAKGEAPGEEEAPERSFAWIAGLAGALGVVLAGLWLARRSR